MVCVQDSQLGSYFTILISIAIRTELFRVTLRYDSEILTMSVDFYRLREDFNSIISKKSK